MAVQERLLTVSDVLALSQRPENENCRYELIDGKLSVTMDPPLRPHGLLAVEIAFHLALYNKTHRLGEVTVESGHHPPHYEYTLLGPDVAFTSFARLSDPPPEKYYPVMPDLAVEIMSPNDTLAKTRRKAERFLRDGSLLVWIVQPKRLGVEVCRLLDDGSVGALFVGEGETLLAPDILPGFELTIDELFDATRR